MRKSQKKSVFAFIVIVLICICNFANATNDSFKIELMSTTDEMLQGEEITITVKIKDINMGEYGINTLEGIISYDKEIFEEIKANDVQGQNGWTITYNDENSLLNGKFLATNFSKGIKENVDIFTVKLKLKENIAKTQITEIIFNDITSNNGIDLINIGDQTLSINVIKEEIELSAEAKANNKEKKAEERINNIGIIVGTVILFAMIFLIILRKKNMKRKK